MECISPRLPHCLAVNQLVSLTAQQLHSAASHTPNHIGCYIPMKITEGLMYVFDRKGHCQCEWSWHLSEKGQGNVVVCLLPGDLYWNRKKDILTGTSDTMHTGIAYISTDWDIIVAVRRRWLWAALLWQSWVTLAMCAYTQAQGRWTQTGRQSDKGLGKERERKQPRLNSAPWTATIRHLFRQHLFAFISRRWIDYSWQSQCWISTLV